MCSRYSLTSPAEAVRAYFGHANTVEFPPRYNIAPSQPVGIVRTGHDGAREFALVRWGLIPSWVKDPRSFTMLINARSESILEKPSFRGSIRHRRCIVPADGFYEWTGPPKNKQPHLIRSKSNGPMGFAGVWEHWLGADGSEMESMAIITTDANATMATIHDRMPAILPDARLRRMARQPRCLGRRCSRAVAAGAGRPVDHHRRRQGSQQCPQRGTGIATPDCR